MYSNRSSIDRNVDDKESSKTSTNYSKFKNKKKSNDLQINLEIEGKRGHEEFEIFPIKLMTPFSAESSRF